MTFSRRKKVGIGAVTVVILLVIVFYGLGKNSDAVNVWLARRQEKALQVWVDKNLERERQAYRDDIDGGKTPEETVGLFLTALKAGNLDQAAKYYELPLQEKALKNLKDEKAQYGNVDQTIAYFEEVMKKGTKGCNEKGDGCTFELKYKTGKTEKVLVSGTKNEYLTIPGGVDSSRIIDTSKNLQSNVWKIVFPF